MRENYLYMKTSEDEWKRSSPWEKLETEAQIIMQIIGKYGTMNPSFICYGATALKYKCKKLKKGDSISILSLQNAYTTYNA